MFTRSARQVSIVFATWFCVAIVQAEDLHYKKNISVGGNSVSSSETWVKGARERTVTSSPAGNIVTLRQCDLKRTVTLNERSQSYMVLNDPPDDSAANAAAIITGAPAPAANSGRTITQTATITDSGERKQLSGYSARHLKTTVVVESSSNSCSKLSQKFEIDGWYTDLVKAPLSCSSSLPPLRQQDGCADRVIVRHKGTGKLGYPLHETITVENEGANATKLDVTTSDISKGTLGAELFDVPAGYREVKSLAELYTSAAAVTQGAPASGFAATPQPLMNGAPSAPAVAPGFSAQIPMMPQNMSGQFQNAMPGMGMQNSAAGAAVPLPQALGPKAPGKIRIGIAPAEAQLGQGNNAQADYSTPIRNAIIYMMNGPAVEIAALDARLPMQVHAEAQQKQCDYILFSNVAVKHSNSGFGKFMKMGSMAANVTPMGMMTKSMTAAMASQAAAQAAAMTAQQQAVNQLSQFNGQIKSKDDVSIDYHLFPTGQSQAKLDSSLRGKAKSDGEDVLTPLIQQAANSILTEVTKK